MIGKPATTSDHYVHLNKTIIQEDKTKKERVTNHYREFVRDTQMDVTSNKKFAEILYDDVMRNGTNEEKRAWSMFRHSNEAMFNGPLGPLSNGFPYEDLIGDFYFLALGKRTTQSSTPNIPSSYSTYDISRKEKSAKHRIIDIPGEYNASALLMLAIKEFSNEQYPISYTMIERNPQAFNQGTLDRQKTNIHKEYMEEVAQKILKENIAENKKNLYIRASGVGIYEALYILKHYITISASEKRNLPKIHLELNNPELCFPGIRSTKKSNGDDVKPEAVLKILCENIEQLLKKNYKSGKVTATVGLTEEQKPNQKAVNTFFDGLKKIAKTTKKKLPTNNVTLFQDATDLAKLSKKGYKAGRDTRQNTNTEKNDELKEIVRNIDIIRGESGDKLRRR